jgi:hypothetical protein
MPDYMLVFGIAVLTHYSEFDSIEVKKTFLKLRLAKEEGIDVMITIFMRFWPIFGENIGFFPLKLIL